MAKTPSTTRTPAPRSGKPHRDANPTPPADAQTMRLPSDVARPSATDDVTNEDEPDGRPTAREGLKPIGRERPHPTAAARPGKTSGEAATMGAVPPADPNPSDRERPIQVEAIKLGYYDHTRRRTGDVFMIASEDAFSDRWMRRTDGHARPRVTTSRQALKRENDELRELKHPPAGMQVGRDNVPDDLRQGTDNPLGE